MTRSKVLTADLRVYVRPGEKDAFENRAREFGLSLSQWARQRLLEAEQISNRPYQKNDGLKPVTGPQRC
jgi:hypothetical protein